MRIQLCGVRGSTPAPGAAFAAVGGNTSCVAITPNDRGVPALLLDAGTGIRSVSELVEPGPFRGTILLSHLHWDHVQGLPFFGAGDRDGSDVRLLFPAEAGSGDAVTVLRRCMSPPHFPIGPEGLQGRWRFEFVDEGSHDIEGFRVVAADIPHKGGRTFGYRISDRDGSVAYLPDHLPAADGPRRARALALARGADVLIHDSQFLASEHRLADAYGHSTIPQAIAFATDAEVDRLVLFHHAPGRTDDELESIHRAAVESAHTTGAVRVHLGKEGDDLTVRARGHDGSA